MAFEKIPPPGNPEKEERIRFGEGERQYSMTPEEKEAHEKAEARKRILEQKGATEAKESEPEDLELTEEEQKIAKKIVPDPETRKQLGLEALRMMIDNYEETDDEENQSAA